MLDCDLEMPSAEPLIYEICPVCGNEMDYDFRKLQIECSCGKIISFPDVDWEFANDY